MLILFLIVILHVFLRDFALVTSDFKSLVINNAFPKKSSTKLLGLSNMGTSALLGLGVF